MVDGPLESRQHVASLQQRNTTDGAVLSSVRDSSCSVHVQMTGVRSQQYDQSLDSGRRHLVASAESTPWVQLSCMQATFLPIQWDTPHYVVTHHYARAREVQVRTCCVACRFSNSSF